MLTRVAIAVAVMSTLLLAGVVAVRQTFHVEELRRAQRELDVQLAERKEQADNLMETRRRLDELEAVLKREAVDLTEDQAAAVADAEPPRPPASPAAPAVVVPPESLLEGSEAARLRARIADTHRRVAELDKVIREVLRLKHESESVAARLTKLRQLRGETPR